MADYPKMYQTLFGATTKAIEILKQAQIDAESLYINADETPLFIVPPCTEEKDKEEKSSPT